MATQVSPENLDKAFALLVDCAVAGARCPVTTGPDKHRFLVSAHTSALARQGRILIEISGQNWRQITILTGLHKGKSTAPNPDPTRPRVWQIVGKNGAYVNGERVSAATRIAP